MTDSPKLLKVIAAACLLVSIANAAAVLVALFDPPPWNRVERALHAWAWFYVGYLHWRLARVLTGEGPVQRVGRVEGS